MKASVKIKLFEIVHESGKIEYRLLSLQEARSFKRTKQYKKIIAAKAIRTLKLSINIQNLAT